MELVATTYRLTDTFPQRERYGIVAQMRSAAISIPANLAEGHARHSVRDFLRFIDIAIGSLRELQTYAEVSAQLALAPESELAQMQVLTDEAGRVLHGLARGLRRKLPPER